MKCVLRHRAFVVLTVCQLFMLPASSHAFSLFGIHLWGEEDEDEDISQIDIQDPLPYSVTLKNTGSDNIDEIVQNSSSLWAGKDSPADGKAGLISKGRSDYRRILAALYRVGYFAADVSIQADGDEVSELTLATEFPNNVNIVIAVNSGKKFRFGQTDLLNGPPPLPDAEDPEVKPDGFETGQPAETRAIDIASSQAILEWRRRSRAKAREADREIIADHTSQELDVAVTIDPGPEVRYGPISVEGESQVDPEFTAYMADLPEGQNYDPEEVSDAKDRLAKLGVFNGIRLTGSDTVADDGTMPIMLEVSDRKRRGIGFGGTYSTLDGLGLSAFWLHRNLFGRAERLRFDASIEGLIETTDPEEFDYNLGVSFNKPGVFTPDTGMLASVVARQLDFDTYRETSLTGRFGFSHEFSDRLTGELYGELAKARYVDGFGVRHFMTWGLVGRAEYDRRDNEFDATEGYYLRAELRPFYESEYSNFAINGSLEGRIFHGFGEENKFILAARAKVGSYAGPSIEESPPNLLFFAGGGGSVRGYSFQSIGVAGSETVDEDGDPIVTGGRSLAEMSGEVRMRFSDKFGAVAFVDAGTVNAGPDFTDIDDLRVGVGLGARYYTGIGPLRVDVAVPMDKRDTDDDFGVYIGIGQAF